MKKELISIDKYGTRSYRVQVTCDRCGGDGVYKWGGMISDLGGRPRPRFAGTCFKCGGAGVIDAIEKEYTPERRAQLDKQNEKRAAKTAEKRAAELAEQDRINEARRVEREKREAERAAARAVSQYVGQIGDKVQSWVTLTRVGNYPARDYFGREAVGAVYTFTDDGGNVMVWFTQRGGLGDYNINTGDRIQIAGTVKKYQEYDGQKQTVLTRVKLMDLEVIRL